MVNLLQDLASTLMASPQLRSPLAELAFVPTSSGQLTAPRQLYDPRNEQLKDLLDPSKAYPSSPFDGDEVCHFQSVNAMCRGIQH